MYLKILAKQKQFKSKTNRKKLKTSGWKLTKLRLKNTKDRESRVNV